MVPDVAQAPGARRGGGDAGGRGGLTLAWPHLLRQPLLGARPPPARLWVTHLAVCGPDFPVTEECVRVYNFLIFKYCL